MTRMLTVFALLFCFGLSCFAAFEEETVLLYLFDEETDDEATDLSEFENHGEITDAEWTEDGKIGGALVFDGASSLIEVPHHDSLSPGGDELTIEAWFKPNTFPGGHPPIARKGTVAESGWGFDTPGGKIRGFVYTAPGNPVVANGTTQMELDTWHHVAMVYDGEEIRIYLDGELDGEGRTRRGPSMKTKPPSGSARKRMRTSGLMERLMNSVFSMSQSQKNRFRKI